MFSEYFKGFFFSFFFFSFFIILTIGSGHGLIWFYSFWSWLSRLAACGFYKKHNLRFKASEVHPPLVLGLSQPLLGFLGKHFLCLPDEGHSLVFLGFLSMAPHHSTDCLHHHPASSRCLLISLCSCLRAFVSVLSIQEMRW